VHIKRSVLCVPGSDEHKITKAAATDADEIVLDLEDAVAPSSKDAARELVARALVSPALSERRVAVRVNAPGSPWCHADIEACVRAGGALQSIVLPKVESAGELAFADRLLDGVEAAARAGTSIEVEALIETATGLVNITEIASASSRLTALILGYADLAASLGRSATVPPEVWLPTQDAVVRAARSVGIAAIDGPHLGVGVDEVFNAAVVRATEIGFDGKWVIHPRQVDAVNEAFAPAPERVAWARRVVDALQHGHASGIGAVSVDGQMIDEAVVVAARRVLARAGGAG